MLPLLLDGELPFADGDYIFLPGIRQALASKRGEFEAYALTPGGCRPFTLRMDEITDDERAIILSGCLINYYRDDGQQ